jgi:hypothetical protein
MGVFSLAGSDAAGAWVDWLPAVAGLGLRFLVVGGFIVLIVRSRL